MSEITPAPVRAKKRVTFTPDEARRSLVYVGRIVEDIVGEDASIARKVLACDDAGVVLTGAYGQMDVYVDELALMGVKVEDSCHGVVWFPTRRNNRRAWIAWELEYPDRLTWHYEGDHTTGRPIETFAE